MFKSSRLKTASILWPITSDTDIRVNLENMPPIVWECGKKNCCKKYQKPKKKHCKKCPKVN